MTSNRTTRLFLSLTFLAWWNVIQTNNVGAVEPCDSGFLSGYHHKLDRVIDEAVSGIPQLSITVIPSFYAEWGVRVVGNDVHVAHLESSLWEQSHLTDWLQPLDKDSASPRIPTLVHHAPLKPDTSTRVRDFYGSVLAHARDSSGVGSDGVIYQFTLPGVGCKQAWSPEPKSTEAHLVKILQLLADHARLNAPDAIQRSEEVIIRVLDELTSP